MDLHLDTSWCPVCDRQIQPKRLLVPIPPSSAVPPPSPTSPRSSSPKPHNPSEPPVRRSKNATLRARTGGLVHGTGRVKPNGALKRTDSTKSQHVPPSPLAPKPVSPVKHRTVIDQGPIPLYCSDECQMKDISNSYNGLAFDYDPHRSSPPVPPVPHNSFSDRTAVSESESDSSAGSSVESSSGSSNSSHKQPHVSSSIAVLAAMYNFPPLPPPAPVFPEDDIPARPYNNYQSGIMMAGRRLQEALCPEPPKRTAYGQNYPPEPRKPIPGWTDGSTAWRASLYSFSAPTDLSTSSSQDDITKAYQSFAASPHRSHGVYSTLSDSARAMAAGPFPSRRTEETEELYVKYSESLSRRSESRASLFPVSSPTSISPPNSIQRRERPLVKPGAEGKLLVPNVKMRVHGGSSSSLSSAWCGSSYPATSRRIAKNASHLSDDDAQTDPLSFQRPKTTEIRSWSYDNLKTYPVMQLPPKKEKRIETRMVDGRAVDVEVEVEVVRPMKRLFLFPGKETSRERC